MNALDQLNRDPFSNKAWNVIMSCQTEEQLETAAKYKDLYIQQISREMNKDDVAKVDKVLKLIQRSQEKFVLYVKRRRYKLQGAPLMSGL